MGIVSTGGERMHPGAIRRVHGVNGPVTAERDLAHAFGRRWWRPRRIHDDVAADQVIEPDLAAVAPKGSLRAEVLGGAEAVVGQWVGEAELVGHGAAGRTVVDRPPPELLSDGGGVVGALDDASDPRRFPAYDGEAGHAAKHAAAGRRVEDAKAAGD